MKRIFTTILMAVGFTSPFTTQLAAQGNRGLAEIPFAFTAGTRTLPAGTYEVSRLSLTGFSTVFTVMDNRGHSILVALNQRVQGNPEKPSLTFACYEKECVLAKVTPPDSAVAYNLSETYIEKQLHHSVGVASMISIKIGSH
jgi:hypothetical protein